MQQQHQLRLQQDSQSIRSNNTPSSSNSILQQQLRSDSLNNNTPVHHHHQQQQQQQQQHHHLSEALNQPNLSSTTENNATIISSTNPSAANLRHHFLLQMSQNPIISTTPSATSTTSQTSSVQMHLTPTQALKQQNTNEDNINESPSNSTLGENDNNKLIYSSSRPVQRRRIRRKPASTMDDQAEHLTEMSVRGLDLFRYASITEGVYQCIECAKENIQRTFKNKYSFQRHAFLYHEGKHRKVFPCPQCGKEFSRPDKMKNHMKTTHEGFIAKEATYNPFNYLITATSAGDIQQTFPKLDNNYVALNIATNNSNNINLINKTANNLSSPLNETNVEEKTVPSISIAPTSKPPPLEKIKIKAEMNMYNPPPSSPSRSRSVSPERMEQQTVLSPTTISVVHTSSGAISQISPLKETEEVK